MNLLEGLNDAQQSAVQTTEGPLLILAGPGSGKTRVITHRVAYLIQVVGVSPRRIMAVTFTNKAAREMKDRLQGLIGAAVHDLTVGTFHSICSRILRRDGEAIRLDNRFVIYDDADQLALVKQVLIDLSLDPKKYAPRAVLSAISRAKSELITPSTFQVGSFFEEIVQRVYEVYQRRLWTAQALDFDDLLLTTVEMLRDQEEVRRRYQSRYLHILVDEFQDTNTVQYQLIKLLSGEHRNVCVVGDPDQSIYSWRSADIRNILDFEGDFENAKTVLLEQNYRSTQTILDAAHAVIVANNQRKEKRLWTENPTGAAITAMEAYNEEEEAAWVVGEIERLTDARHFEARDCAVMYRTKAQSRAIEEAFVRFGIPYKLVAGTRFYDRREIKDAMAYLRMMSNPYDEVALHRIINVPGRGVGQKTIDDLQRWARDESLPLFTALQLLDEHQRRESGEDGGSDEALAEIPDVPFSARSRQSLLGFYAVAKELIAGAETTPLPELITSVLEVTGYREMLSDGSPEGVERWENLEELRNVAESYRDLEPGAALTAFLEETALLSDTDGYDEKPDAVTLITLHAAKGLEFPVVFLVGMEEGVFPHVRSFDDPDQMEEERRLAYVGMTRAKERLYLVRAFRRTTMGASNPNPPSRFLKDVPPELIEAKGSYGKTSGGYRAGRGLWDGLQSAPRTSGPAVPAGGFRTGDHVAHPKFGDGVVVTCKENGDDQEVTVAFKGSGVKKLLASLARLEKVS